MAKHPKKLKNDSIAEALLEIRFTSPSIPELFVGRLVAEMATYAKDMTVERLPMADLPAPLRRADPNLAHQPTLQLRSASGQRIARIGETVISWHALQPYPGWETFQPEIVRITKLVTSAIPDVSITRLGLRYLNFFKKNEHPVSGLAQLTLDVLIGGKMLELPMNVNYKRDFEHYGMAVRIATPEFVTPASSDLSLLVDIDMNTDEKICPQIGGVVEWAEAAHNSLKDEFFTLLKPDVLQALVED